jgi:CBS domain-containing membrane protein
MATHVEEIMNRELYAARAGNSVADVTASLLAFGISAAPVLDEATRAVGFVSLRDLVTQPPGRSIAEVMTSPATIISADVTIQEAGHVLAMTGYHHLPVVDASARVVGFVSALDVVRGLLGLAATHPAAFPHLDAETGVTWTD